MSERIRGLVQQIHDLEEELRTALHQQEDQVLYEIEGRRVRFKSFVKDAHKQLKTGLVPWFVASSLRNALSAPFVYGMVFPMLLYDASLTIYQASCFRLYGIKRVDRSKYILIDRHHLGYLNILERLHCVYCGYANGLIAYATEITARTEQYWCPIKHARKVLGSHRRYPYFLNYGDAEGYQGKLEDERRRLRD
jgi:hypothetical protein